MLTQLGVEGVELLGDDLAALPALVLAVDFEGVVLLGLLLKGQGVIVTRGHSVKVSQCQGVTVSRGHSVKGSQCQGSVSRVTVSRGHSVKGQCQGSQCQGVTVSRGHCVKGPQ